MDIYDDFVTNALQFGCSNTKRRPSGASLRPSDIAVYLERTYHITVPGFGNADAREVKPYRKIVATELHKSRQRIARETSLEEDRAMAKARKSVAASDQFVTDVGGKGQAIVSVLGPQAAVPRGV
jgi:transcription initiation factor TFIID subunit TAF12